MSDKLNKSQVKKDNTIKQNDIGIIVEKKNRIFQGCSSKNNIACSKKQSI